MHPQQQQQQQRRGNPSPILISLFIQLFQQFQRLPYKPPVTIAFLLINIIIHIHPSPNFLGYYLSNVQENCLHPQKILTALLASSSYRHPITSTLLWNRLIFSAFIHADDMHLYYNMLSFAWKGIHLESFLGSNHFLALILFSLLTSHTLLILFSYVLYIFCGFSAANAGFTSCAVGFSAVIFALKLVWNTLSPDAQHDGRSSIMGLFTVPLKYAAWAELVLISFLSPNASFLGHLAGIVAGYAYLYGIYYPYILGGSGGGRMAGGWMGGGWMRRWNTWINSSGSIQRPARAATAANNQTGAASYASTASSYAANNDEVIYLEEDEELVELEHENDLSQHQRPSSATASSSSTASSYQLTAEELRQQRSQRYDNNNNSSHNTGFRRRK